jgi:hypothetical protein
VPPPPVSGAAVGNAGVAGADVCVGAEVGVGAEVCVGAGVPLWVGAGVPLCVGFAVAELDACEEVDVCGEPDADALPRPVADVLGDEPPEVRETWPVGEGVRVPGWLDDCPLVWGVGVKIDGTDELLPVQADTVMARRTAPAAERPAISHALWAAAGWVRRIFMNPPRMRVR